MSDHDLMVCIVSVAVAAASWLAVEAVRRVLRRRIRRKLAELEAADDGLAMGAALKAMLGDPTTTSGTHVHTYTPREYLTLDEIAAQVSAEHDVHVDCVQATLRQLAEWWDMDVDELVRFDPAQLTFTTDQEGTL
jgi:hypothetical protein